MDRVTEQLMKTWATNHGSDLGETSVLFERFANFVALSKHNDDQFNVEDYSCGEDGTLGIDGFALSVNGELIPTMEELEDVLSDGKRTIDAAVTVVQSKSSPSFDLGGVSVFADTAIALLLLGDEPPDSNLTTQHQLLTRLFQESARFAENPSCRMYYVTTGNWEAPAPIVAKGNDTISRLAETNMFSRVDFLFWGAKELQANWRSIDAPQAVTINFDQRTTLPEIKGINEAYLGVLPATEFVKLVADEEGQIRKTIFFDNIRDFQGDENEVNKDIERSLDPESASRFCVLNNGVTVVARESKVTGNRFTMRDFQVVNGCQTSHILQKNRDRLDGVYVPFRLIVSPDQEITNEITKATNNQSNITKENLLALSDLQKRIESYFNSYHDDPEHRIFYERRSKQWSDSAQVRGTWRVITLKNLMQAFAAVYLKIPHTAARYYTDLRSRAGTDIFSDHHHAAYYYSAAYSFCKLEHFFRNNQVDRSMKSVRYHLLAGARTLYSGSTKAEGIERGAKRAEASCDEFNKVVWDDAAYLDLIKKSERALLDLAGGDEISRDTGRNRDFVDQYLVKLLTDHSAQGSE